MVDVPWDIAVGGDLAVPGVQGRRTLKVRLINAYIARLHAAAAHDASLATAFVRVAGLVAPPRTLLRPNVAVRVLRASLHPATGTVVVSSNRDAVRAAPTLADNEDLSPQHRWWSVARGSRQVTEIDHQTWVGRRGGACRPLQPNGSCQLCAWEAGA